MWIVCVNWTEFENALINMFDLQEECASMMQDLSDKINNKHHEVRTHPLLSIFKMAEVEVKMPYSNEAAISRSSSVLLVVLFAISFFGSTCSFGSWQGHQDITKNLYRVSSLWRIATCRVHVVAAVPTIGGSTLMRENSWPWRAQIHEGKKPRLALDRRADQQIAGIDRRIRTEIPTHSRRSRIAHRAIEDIIKYILIFNGIFVTYYISTGRPRTLVLILWLSYNSGSWKHAMVT